MTKHRLLDFSIAAVWFVNGFICKVLNLVPRHQQIVAQILGVSHARTMTILIGSAECSMAVWILSGLWPRFNVITQIIVIAIMNTLEFFLVPDLLLWGKLNALFAFLLILLIYWNSFYLKRNYSINT